MLYLALTVTLVADQHSFKEQTDGWYLKISTLLCLGKDQIQC